MKAIYLCPECDLWAFDVGSIPHDEHCSQTLDPIAFVPRSHIVEEVMEAQAEIQTPLGIFRVDAAKIDIPYAHSIEDYLAKSLARLHRLLGELNSPMYRPAQHPEIQ